MSVRTLMKKKMRSVDRPGNIDILEASRFNYEYAGSPNGSLTGELLGLCYDTSNDDIYINTNGATAWSKVVD